MGGRAARARGGSSRGMIENLPQDLLSKENYRRKFSTRVGGGSELGLSSCRLHRTGLSAHGNGEKAPGIE